MEHIIVGIDPGKTSAIACITLDGKLVYTAHKTFAGTDWIIKTINSIGVPSVIATDKKTVNENVRRVNAAFNSRIFSPEKDITVADKRELAKAIDIKNRHEQDAYAAAIKAYNSYSNKLRQADHTIRGMDVAKDAIRAKIIKKYSINEAILNKRPNRK